MRNVVNSNKVITTKLANDALTAKNINKTWKMEVQEQKRTMLKLKIWLKTLNYIKHGPEQAMKGFEEQEYVKINGGRCRHVEAVDFKYVGIIYEVKR